MYKVTCEQNYLKNNCEKQLISTINIYFAINQLHCLTLFVRAEVLTKYEMKMKSSSFFDLERGQTVLAKLSGHHSVHILHIYL